MSFGFSTDGSLIFATAVPHCSVNERTSLGHLKVFVQTRPVFRSVAMLKLVKKVWLTRSVSKFYFFFVVVWIG